MDLSHYKEKIKAVDDDPSHRYKSKIIDLATFAPKYSSVIIVDPSHSQHLPERTQPRRNFNSVSEALYDHLKWSRRFSRNSIL